MREASTSPRLMVDWSASEVDTTATSTSTSPLDSSVMLGSVGGTEANSSNSLGSDDE